MLLKSQEKARSSTRDFIRGTKYLRYITVQKNQCHGFTVAHIKTSGLGFDHVKKLIYIHKNAVLTFIVFIS
jgi:hypothetical protein